MDCHLVLTLACALTFNAITDRLPASARIDLMDTSLRFHEVKLAFLVREHWRAGSDGRWHFRGQRKGLKFEQAFQTAFLNARLNKKD